MDRTSGKLNKIKLTEMKFIAFLFLACACVSCVKYTFYSDPVDIESMCGEYILIDSETKSKSLLLNLNGTYQYSESRLDDMLYFEEGTWEYYISTQELRYNGLWTTSDKDKTREMKFYVCEYWGDIIIGRPQGAVDPDGAPQQKWFKRVE